MGWSLVWVILPKLLVKTIFLLRFSVETKLRNKRFLILVTSTCIVNLGNCIILRNNFPMCPWIILQLSYKGTFVYIIYSIVPPLPPQRWNGEYHRVSTYPGKSDNNEICSLNLFIGVIVLYPKSIPWALELNIISTKFPAEVYTCMVRFLHLWIQKFGCLIPRLSLKLNFGAGGI